MFATRMLAIGSLFWGMSAFAQSSAARLDYAGRLFDQSGNPFVGVISVRADIRVTVAGLPCVLYRREQMAGAGDQIQTDGDGQFDVVIRTGVNAIDPTEYEAAGLGSILSLTQITPLTCQDGVRTFVPSSNPERIVEISVSLNHGSTWEVVDEQLVSLAAQSFDTMAFAGLPIANFVYDNGDGRITRAKVETLLDSPHSANLRDFATSGTLAVSSLSLSSFGTLGTSVVNRDYANENLAGADATSLGGLGAGDANQFIMWDGSKWVAGAPPATTIAGLSGQLQFNGGGTLAAAAVLNWDSVNSRLGVGTLSPAAALHVAGAGPSLHVQETGAASRQIRLKDSAGTTLADIGAGSGYAFGLYPGVASTPSLFVHADGRVGVGHTSMPINATSFYANRITQNPPADENASAFLSTPSFTANSNFNVRGVFASVSPRVDAGMTASGVMMGMESRAIVDTVTGGNFHFLTGLRTSAGSYAGFSGTIGYAVGLHVIPERGSGQIGTLVGALIDSPMGGGGTVLNEFGLQQISATARNEFGGRLTVGATNVANSAILQVYRDQNANTSAVVRNNATGTNARSSIYLQHDAGQAGGLWTASTAYLTPHLSQSLNLEAEGSGVLNLISANDLRMYTGGRNVGNEAMRITNGSVSIGYTTADARLGIQGVSGRTLKIVDGNQGAGKVLTSDATGQASWQNPPAGGGSVTVSNGTVGNISTETHVMNYTAVAGAGIANSTSSQLNFTGSGGPQLLSGAYGKLTVNGNITSQFAAGGIFHLKADAGTTTSANGVYGIIEHTGGVLNSAAAGRFDFVSGFATNAYGVYIGGVSGTNKWSLFSNQIDAPVYVAGSMGLGVTVPSEKLEVAGVVYASAGGFKFPDGSVQTRASNGSPVFIVMNSTCPIATTCYTAPGMSSVSTGEIQVPVPRAGVVREILIRTSSAQPGDGAISVTLRKAMVNGISATIPAGATPGIYKGNGVMNFVAEDLISIRLQNLSSTGLSAHLVSVSFVYE